VAPIITGIIVHFRFHIRCISIHKLLYFNFFSSSSFYYYYFIILKLLILCLAGYGAESCVTLVQLSGIVKSCSSAMWNEWKYSFQYTRTMLGQTATRYRSSCLLFWRTRTPNVSHSTVPASGRNR
jgi:hypothetical protein